MTDGEQLCFTAALVLLVAVVAWHALAALVCVAARLWPQRRTLTSWAARAPVLARRLAVYACGATLAVQPAIAHGATADVPVVRAPATATTTTSAPAPEIAPEPAVTDAPAPPPVATPVSANYLVAPGDNLWRIAAAELTRRTGATPHDDAIARYWRAVVDANRSTLRSGEPSLIYPGELVVLPAP